ncbi:hypothetical protein J4217_03330 [Candidatus Pacearchaeota archaeon]|nr:hypothetical protein [Candidatus Pacearchaeota archaeon]
MRYEEKRQMVEVMVYDAIDEIAEEIGLGIPFYPQVYHFGEKEDLKASRLPEIILNKCTERIKFNESFFWQNLNSIFIFVDKEKVMGIGEESAHFLRSLAPLYKSKKVDKETLPKRTIDETLAFFSSKLRMPDRINNFEAYKDIVPMSPLQVNMFLEQIKESLPNLTKDEFFIYQQGYGLGDRLYYAYVQGQFSKKRIKDLFTNSFREEGSALDKFWKLRKELWPIEQR